MLYRYEAYNKDRRLIRGTIESVSEETAEAVLYRAGYERITHLREATAAIKWQKFLHGEPKVNKQSLLDFTNELAIMLESGLNLQAALKQLSQTVSQRSLKAVLGRISADLKAGVPLHQAMAAHPQVFSQTYRSIIEANEKSGSLDSGLHQIARELKQDLDTRSQITRALTQPLIVVGVGIVVVLLMVIYVLPRLTGIFTKLGVDLPLTARILIGFSSFVSHNIIVILLAAVVLAAGCVLWYRRPSGKYYLDGLILRLPIIGDLVLWHNTARFTRTLSNLLKAGILLPDAMNIVLRSINNRRIHEAMADVRVRLIQGQSLSTVLENNELFPRFLVEMASVGETSGALESSLATVADYFEVKVQKRLSRITGLLEPILMAILGIGVGYIAITMITTIYGMLGAIK